MFSVWCKELEELYRLCLSLGTEYLKALRQLGLTLGITFDSVYVYFEEKYPLAYAFLF
jgi:hypothetical protein